MSPTQNGEKNLFTTLHRLKLLMDSKTFLDFPLVSLHTARKIETDSNFLTLAGTVGFAAGKGH